MKNTIIIAIIAFILGGVVMYFIRKCETKTVTVEVEVEVPVPGVRDSFPYEVPVLKPYPVTNPTNTKLAAELAKAKSELDSLKVLKEFVKPKLYTSKFKDTIQEIDIDMIASGSVDSVSVKYNIFPRTIVHKDKVDVEVKTQASIWFKASGVMPFNESMMKPTVKPGLMFMTRQGKVAYDLEGDFTNKTVEAGLLFKF